MWNFWIRQYKMIRRIPLRQLNARLQLLIQRRYRVTKSKHFRARLSESTAISPTISSTVPAPIFPARRGMIKPFDQGVSLEFLNTERSMTYPIQWHCPELNIGTRLWKLHLHYMEYLEGASDEIFVTVIDDWITNNPPYQKDYWLDSWNSYALSIRCLVWMQQYQLRENRLAQEFLDRFLTSLWSQLKFLTEHLETDIGGNHLIKNVKTMLWAGEFFKTPETNRWKDSAIAMLQNELEVQILFDGMHYERSPTYHRQVLGDLLECWNVLDNSDVRNQIWKVLEKMIVIDINLTHPDGDPSLFNDGGLSTSYGLDTIIGVWEKLGGEVPKEQEVFSFQSAGYSGLRLGENFVLLDHGKIAPDALPAHGHGDIFSFEWTSGDKRIIVDKGVFEYSAGDRRTSSRSTVSHNTLNIDEQDQCEFWDSFRAGAQPTVSARVILTANSLKMYGSHNGYRRLPGKPIHHRTMELSEGKLIVEDRVTGGNSSQQAEARLLLHPDVRLNKKPGVVYLIRDTIRIGLYTSCPVTTVTTEWFSDFGLAQPCKQLVLEYGAIPVVGGFTLQRT